MEHKPKNSINIFFLKLSSNGFFGGIVSLSKCLSRYYRKTSENDIQIFYFYLIKQLQKCCLATVVKENYFRIASISKNYEYNYPKVCMCQLSCFYHKLSNCYTDRLD